MPDCGRGHGRVVVEDGPKVVFLIQLGTRVKEEVWAKEGVGGKGVGNPRIGVFLILLGTRVKVGTGVAIDRDVAIDHIHLLQLLFLTVGILFLILLLLLGNPKGPPLVYIMEH